MSVHEIALRRVLYEIPGMRSVSVREDESMRTYGANEDSPLVVILDGLPDDRFMAHVGCRFMDMEWTISMAQLLASSGFTAITYSARDPQADALALIEQLRERGRKIGIWATSAHGPVALSAAARADCAVLTNPVTKDFCPDTPLFVVRSGKDETPGLNAALDAFTTRALAENKPLTLLNYPAAPHSFELNLDAADTRKILDQALAFLRLYLAA
jgi:hypothetical protein